MKWKIGKYLGGIKDMPKMPGALFVVDPKKEKIAIAEAKNWVFRLLQQLTLTVTLMK